MEMWERLLRFLPPSLQAALRTLPPETVGAIQDVRLRAGAPLSVSLADGERRLPPTVTARELEQTLIALCGQAVHTHQAQIAKGFITADGGIRAGLAGTAVVQDGEVRSYRQITSLCLRMPREKRGCSAAMRPYLLSADGVPRSLLLCGAPACGKTTLLRDIARWLSEAGKRISVVDERAELAAFSLPFCDVLNGTPKALGILQAVRTLSPDAVLADELGGEEEIRAAAQAMFCGVPLIASVHARSLDELYARPSLWWLLQKGAFSTIALLPPRIRAAQTIERVEEIENSRLDACRVLLCRSGLLGGVATSRTGEAVAGVGNAAARAVYGAAVYGGADPNDPFTLCGR